MKKTVEFRTTKADFREAIKARKNKKYFASGECLLAQTFHRVLSSLSRKRKFDITVGLADLYFNKKTYSLPTKVQEAITKFDDDRKFTDVSFKLKINL